MPEWKSEVRARLRRLGLDPTREAEIAEELAQHLDDQYTELVGRGVPHADAHRIVLEQLAGEAGLADRLRHSERPAGPPPVIGNGSSGGRLRGLWEDVRYGVRSLRKSPGLTTVALITLAVGIGANTAIFSVVNAVLIRPLPVLEPGRLVTFWATAPEKGFAALPLPVALGSYFGRRSRVLGPVAAYESRGMTLTAAGTAERVGGVVVSADFFRLLGLVPLRGRTFLADEDKPGRSSVVVLGHGLWDRRFSRDPAIVGKTITLDGVAATVVGVMPRGIDFPPRADLWMPIGADEAAMECWCYEMIGRLRTGATPADAAAELGRLTDDFWHEQKGDRPADRNSRVIVVPLAKQQAGDFGTAILILLGGVAMVLSIACANIANLLLARAVGRDRELAVRCSLGASPWRIARQVLVESLLLAIAGGAIGFPLALVAVKALGRIVVNEAPHVQTVEPDAKVLVFTLAITLGAGLVFGLAPALRGRRIDLQLSLREGAGRTRGAAGRRLQDAFVVSQFALSLVLLFGAGLLLRSLTNLLAKDAGFQTDRVLVGRVSFPWRGEQDGPRVRAFYSQLADRVKALPGVRAAGLTSIAPFSSSDNGQGFFVQGREPPADEPTPIARVRRVTPGYFEAVGTSIVQGRGIQPTDDEKAPPVALVDETLARRYWPDGNALGHYVRTGIPSAANPWREIVGVVAAVKHRDLRQASGHFIYFPETQYTSWTMDVVIRASVDPASLTPALRREVQALDPELPLYEVHTLEEAVSQSLLSTRLTNLLLGGFAVAALLLAAVGIYGVMSLAVSARIREFGVRLALGAEPAGLVRRIVWDGMRRALLGIVVGLVGAAVLTRSLSSLLYGVTPFDPVTLFGVTGILGGVAVVACYLPARKATRADPVAALRDG